MMKTKTRRCFRMLLATAIAVASVGMAAPLGASVTTHPAESKVSDDREALQFYLTMEDDPEYVAVWRIDHQASLHQWDFYGVTAENWSIPTTEYFVVRDGHIVDDRKRELERIYRHLELFDADEEAKQDALTATRYIVAEGESPLGEVGSDSIPEASSERFEDVELAPPQFERDDDELVIRYFTDTRELLNCHSPPSHYLRHYEIRVSEDFSVDTDRQTRARWQLGTD